MTDFNFDLSEDIEPIELLVINGVKEIQEKILSEVKPVNKITDLTIEQKILINNILWYSEAKDEDLKYMLMTQFGLKDIIAENLTYRHRQSYLADPGFFTIFEKNSIESRNIKSVAMAERFEKRKASNKRKPLYFTR